MPPSNIRISAMQTELAAAQKARDLNGSHSGYHASSQHSAFRRLRRTDALDTLGRKFALSFPASADAGISIHAESGGQSREFARDLATTIACSGVSAVTRHVPTASTDPARDEKSVTRNVMACPLGSEGLTSLRLLPG